MTQGVVYVGKAHGGRCKIGCTRAPKSRIRGIESAAGIKFHAIYVSDQGINYQDIEKAVHKALAEKRDLGEWFKVPFWTAAQRIREHRFQPPLPPDVLSELFHSQ